jgi:prevent-host-death family protein
MRIIRLFFRWWADDANHGAGVSAQFGELQHKALREPIEITRHGRREFVLLSADHYDWLVAAARRNHRTADAAAVVIEAVERAEIDPEHAHLDELMK